MGQTRQHNSIAAYQARLRNPLAHSDLHPIEPVSLNHQPLQTIPDKDSNVPVSQVARSDSSDMLLAHAATLPFVTKRPSSPFLPRPDPTRQPQPAHQPEAGDLARSTLFGKVTAPSPRLHSSGLAPDAGSVATTSSLETNQHGSLQKPRGRPPKLDQFGQRIHKPRVSDPYRRSRKPRWSQLASASSTEPSAATVASTSAAAASASAMVIRRTVKNGWKRHTFKLIVPTTGTVQVIRAPSPSPVAMVTRKRSRTSTSASPVVQATTSPAAKRRKSEPKAKEASRPVVQPKPKLKRRTSQVAEAVEADHGGITSQVDANGVAFGEIRNRKPEAHPELLERVLNPWFRPALSCGGWIRPFQSRSRPNSQLNLQAVVEPSVTGEVEVEGEGVGEAGPGPSSEASRPTRNRRQATLASQLAPALAQSSLWRSSASEGNQLETALGKAPTRAVLQKRRLAFLKDRKQPEDQAEPRRNHVLMDLAFESTIKWTPPNARDGHLDLRRKRIRHAIVGAGPVQQLAGVFPFAPARRKKKDGQLRQAVKDVLASGDKEAIERDRLKSGIRTVPWREAGITAGRGNSRGMAVTEVSPAQEGYEGAHGTGEGRDLLKEWATREPGWDVERDTTAWVPEPVEEDLIRVAEAAEAKAEAAVAAEGAALRWTLVVGVDGYDRGVVAEGDEEEDERAAKRAPPAAPTARPETEGSAVAESVEALTAEVTEVVMTAVAEYGERPMEADSVSVVEANAMAVLGLVNRSQPAQAGEVVQSAVAVAVTEG